MTLASGAVSGAPLMIVQVDEQIGGTVLLEGGSTFANPDGGKAWQEIDRAGCRGLCVGGAQVSEKHCNFLINTGDATASDIETLGENVRARVTANGGPDLRWEIRRVGRSDDSKGAVS